MSRVSVLAKAGRSPAAKFHELRLKYWNQDLDVVCCFEGSDDIEFFLPHVRQRLGLHPDRIDFINCGGKGVVLRLWGWACTRSWNLARVGFFVDRDLDDFLGGNPSSLQVYVTDYYSIESEAISADFFDNVWQDLFRLPITDARRSDWKCAYYDGAQTLARILAPMFYIALATKRCGGGVEFDRVKLDEIVTVGAVGGVARNRTRRSFSYADVFVGQLPAAPMVRIARQELASIDYKLWLRGKFLLWYSMAFFNRMKAKIGARSEPSRAVVKASFSAETSISCLCSRAALPRSLAEFLTGWSSLIVSNGLAPSGSTA